MSSIEFAPAFEAATGSAIRELFPYLSRPGMISFAGGYPSPALLDGDGLEAASQRAWSSRTTALQYGATEGSPALRARLADLCRRRGIACGEGDLLVTAGSQQGLDLLIRTILRPGDLAFLEAPAYPAALQAFRLASVSVQQFAVDEDGLRVELLQEALASRVGAKPRLVYTVPTFSNPSGSTLSIRRREALVRLALEHQFLLIEDDPYGELSFVSERLPTLHEIGRRLAGDGNPVIYLSSLSKTVAPSLRVGWMVAPAPVLRRAAIAKQTVDLCTSPLTQSVAANYLESGRYPAAVANACDEYRRRMLAMSTALVSALEDEVHCIASRGGMFLWAEWNPAWVDPERLFANAVERGVVFVPGHAFYADGKSRGSMRLSYASSSVEDTWRGVERLAEAFHESMR